MKLSSFLKIFKNPEMKVPWFYFLEKTQNQSFFDFEIFSNTEPRLLTKSKNYTTLVMSISARPFGYMSVLPHY
jgi:hypothetical protein